MSPQVALSSTPKLLRRDERRHGTQREKFDRDPIRLARNAVVLSLWLSYQIQKLIETEEVLLLFSQLPQII